MRGLLLRIRGVVDLLRAHARERWVTASDGRENEGENEVTQQLLDPPGYLDPAVVRELHELWEQPPIDFGEELRKAGIDLNNLEE